MAGNLSLLLIVALLGVFSSNQALADKDPPMYAAHDYATAELLTRRKLPEGSKCNGDFGTQLEGIIVEMEQNKDASEELATRLKDQFTDVMTKNKDKGLCVKGTWCDLGICKKRGVIQPRAANVAPAAVSVTSPTAHPPVGNITVPTLPTVVNTSSPTTTPTTPSHASAVFMPRTVYWVTLSIAALSIPRYFMV